MGSYATRIPQTLSVDQQNALLAVTGKAGASCRDYTLYTLALATGLREHELVALNCADVYTTQRGVRDVIYLHTYKGSGSSTNAAAQVVALTAEAREALRRLHAWKSRQGQSTAADAPLFCAARGGRLSTRGVRERFAHWLVQAGIPAEQRSRLCFHSLRHTACTMFHRAGGDLRATQAFARHASVETTQIYTHVTIDDVAAIARQARLGGRR